MDFVLLDQRFPQSDILKQNPLRPLGREGTLVVPPRLTHALNKNPCCDATGRKKPASLFSGTSHRLRRVVIPLLYNGSARIGLLVSFRPFNSEVHSASALLPCFHHDLLGSLEIALKRTRPRQRFCYIVSGIL